MTNLTAETITDLDIRKLREEALAATDYLQVDVCDRALLSDDVDQDCNEVALADMSREVARDRCVDAINRNRAQQEA